MLSIVTACDPAGGQRQLIRNRPVINKLELTQRGTDELIPLPNTVQKGTPSHFINNDMYSMDWLCVFEKRAPLGRALSFFFMMMYQKCLVSF